MIKALIFDCDGLIVDTEWVDYQAWQELYDRHGRELPFELWLDNLGTLDGIDLADYLAQQAAEPLDAESLRRWHEGQFRQRAATLDALPGVAAVMAAAREHGLKLAVASSSRHEWVDGHLARLGLLDTFDCVLGRDDVGGRSKPDPAVYLAALQRLGVEAAEAVALEDSPNGLRAARAAGLRVVAVPNRLVRHLDFSAADLRLDSLADLSLTAITRLNGYEEML